MKKLILLAIVLGAGPAHADPDAIEMSPTEVVTPWSVGVAPRIGLAVPTSKLGATAVGGLELDVALPVAEHRLVLALGGSLTRPSHSGDVADPRVPAGSTYTIKETELALALALDYRFAPAGKSLVPWIGVGPLLHLLRTTETTSIAPGDNTAQSTAFGFELAAGLDVKAGPGFLAGDLRYDYSKLDHYLTGTSSAGKVMIDAGYRLVF
jgi:opacity protein-like surface antigen